MGEIVIEQTAWAKVDQLGPLIRSVAWGTTAAYMWLERVPAGLVDESMRSSGVRLTRLNLDEPFEQWQVGRVFDRTRELRWQHMNGQFHVVWCGDHPPEGFTLLAHGGVSVTDQPYYLWGRRVRPETASELGLRVEPGESIYMQLQIPRALHYPLPGNKEYAQFVVREFYAADGELAYARLCGLQEAE